MVPLDPLISNMTKGLHLCKLGAYFGKAYSAIAVCGRYHKGGINNDPFYLIFNY